MLQSEPRAEVHSEHSTVHTADTERATVQNVVAKPPSAARHEDLSRYENENSLANTSPLKACIRQWHTELQLAHAHYCENRHTCGGLRSLGDILEPEGGANQLAASDTRCAQAAEEAEMLLHGLFFGFRVLPPGRAASDVPSFELRNYPCDSAAAAAIEQNIAEELQAGMLRELDERPRCLTALHAKVEADKIRVLRDYKRPEGLAINEHADAARFRMMRFEDAYPLMQPRCYMAKVDIKAAFRTVPAHREHWSLLAFQWRHHADGRTRYYADTRFPFGLKNSPETFCRLSQAVRAMMAAKGYRATVVYVDDFLIVAATEAECQAALTALLSLLAQLGFTVSAKKTVTPTQELVFLGLLLSSNYDGAGGMRVSVPAEKLAKAHDIAARIAAAEWVTSKQLEKAHGYFEHLAKAVFAAKAFLRRLRESLKQSKTTPAASVRVTRALQLDLRFWQTYAARWNGQAEILRAPVMAEGFLSTDASDWGMGGFYAGEDWFSYGWHELARAHQRLPPHVRKYNKRKLWPNRRVPALWGIEYREQYAVFYSMLRWVERFRGKTVTEHCDNEVARWTLNNGTAENIYVMRLVRHMYRVMADTHMRVWVVRISSEANILADALSRNQMRTFRTALADWRPPAPTQWQTRTFVDTPLLTHRVHNYRGAAAAVGRAAAHDSDDEGSNSDLTDIDDLDTDI